MDRFKKICFIVNQYFNSLKFRIVAIIIIFVVIPVSLMEYVTHNRYQDEVVENTKVSMQTQSAALAGEIRKYQDISLSQIQQYASIIQQYSTINDARILLVDAGYVIAYDTYSFENGKTMLSKELIQTFRTKKTASSYNRENAGIRVMTPVTDLNNSVFAVVLMEKDANEVLAFSDEIAQDTYVIKIAILTVVVLLAPLLALLFTKPFAEITGQVRDISMGHYDKRIEGAMPTEMQQMTEGFNDILDKMHVLDESRQEFVSNVSHELKTPITSMKVLADSLNTQEDAPIELYREFMQDIVDEIDRESKIIDDLLTLVKLDKSAQELNISSVSINEILELILKRLKPIAQKKNIELLFESFRPVVAEIDEVKFTIAISNLVENAIKYNSDDGWVHVSLNADHQFFYVRVEDNGIGIPKDAQKMVFERFYRVDKARSRQTGGTGLGLAIVRNCVLMHHGEVRLHSEEDVGTTFTVRIPLNYIEDKKNE